MRRVSGSHRKSPRTALRRCGTLPSLHLALEPLEERTVPSRVLLWVALDPTYPSGGGGGIGGNAILNGPLNGNSAKIQTITPNDSQPVYYADTSGVGNWDVIQIFKPPNSPPTYSSLGLTNTVNPGDALIFDPSISASDGAGNFYPGSNAPCVLNMPGYLPSLPGSGGQVFSLGQIYMDLSYTATITVGTPILISNPGGTIVQSPGLGGVNGLVMENGAFTGQPITIDGAQVANGAGGYFYTTGYWDYGTINTGYFNIGYDLSNSPNPGYTYYNHAQFWISALAGTPSKEHYIVATIFTNYSTTWWNGGEITLDNQSTLTTTWGPAYLYVQGSADYIYSDGNNDNVWNYGGTFYCEQGGTLHVQEPFENQGAFNLANSVDFDVYAWQNGGTTTFESATVVLDMTGALNNTGNGTTYWDPLGSIVGSGIFLGNVSTDNSFQQNQGQGVLQPWLNGLFISGNLTLTSNSLIVINTSPAATHVPAVSVGGQILGKPANLVVTVSSAWTPTGGGQWMILHWGAGNYPTFSTMGFSPTAIWTINGQTYVWGFTLSGGVNQWSIVFGQQGGGGGGGLGGSVVLGGGGALQPASASPSSAFAPQFPNTAATLLLGNSLPEATPRGEALFSSSDLDPLVVDALMRDESREF